MRLFLKIVKNIFNYSTQQRTIKATQIQDKGHLRDKELILKQVTYSKDWQNSLLS